MLGLSALSAACILAGCSDKETPFVEKSYEADKTQVEEVNIDVRDSEITVSVSADDQIHVEYLENEQDYYDISISEDKVLTMTAKSNKKWTDYIGSTSGSRKISLQIPDSLLEKLTLATTNEDIVLSPLCVTDEVSLAVNGGNIMFDKLDVGNALTLTGKNGNISGTVIGSYDDFSISNEIKKGESNLPSEKKDGDKSLKATNNNGDIDIQFHKVKQ